MTCNVGNAERVMRTIAGLSVALFALLGPVAGAWQIAIFIIAAVAVVTGVLGFCPLHTVLVGISTCSVKR